MRLTAELLAYLGDEKYSNALPVRFEREAVDCEYRSRFDVLRELCRGKRVIHVGCVDHDVMSIEKKIQRGKWLHKELCTVTAACFGVDIRQDGIEYIRDVLGYDQAAVLDILHDADDRLDQETWDYILLPEVLEHIPDPRAFLAALGDRFRGKVGELVITVPNAFSRENARHAAMEVEIINSDHCFWFTPYTLSRIVTKAGMSVEQIVMCRHGIVKKRALFRNAYYRRHPMLRNNIVARIRL
ncbi:MAG: methyltransferase domain-containing protein [Gammaproteobacteria bacterium]|nr:methyltransferase domain-containing protein [Gammaproteobacteria bacterium]